MELQINRAVRKKHYPCSDPIEEAMDRARYKCRIFHMYTIACSSLYDDLAIYRKGVAGKQPSIAFAKPLASGNLECLVYIFPDEVQLQRFLTENREYNLLYKLTKERKIL